LGVRPAYRTQVTLLRARICLGVSPLRPLWRQAWTASMLLRVGVVLFVGLIMLNGAAMVQSASGQVVGVSSALAQSPLVGPLATTSTAPPTSTLNITGTWQDDSGNVCSDCTFSIKASPLSGPNPYNLYSFTGSYQADPSCPAATGTEFIDSVVFGNNGSTTAPFFIGLCTRPTNPIVQNCSQPSLWSTTFNATVSPNTITGAYLSQYWIWNTTSTGAIIPSTCHISYTFSQPFTLVRMSSPATPPSNSSTSQQNSGSPTVPIVQTSTTSSSGSSSTPRSGSGGILLPVGLVILLVVVGVGFVLLKFRPIKPRPKV